VRVVIWFAFGVVAMLLVLFMLGACKVAGDADEAAERRIATNTDEGIGG